MRILCLLIAMAFVFPAGIIEAKMTHKWDEEHYANGEFHVKKHDYPKSKNQVAVPEKEIDPDEGVRIDHLGRVYRESEFPPPRHPMPADPVQSQPQ